MQAPHMKANQCFKKTEKKELNSSNYQLVDDLTSNFYKS